LYRFIETRPSSKTEHLGHLLNSSLLNCKAFQNIFGFQTTV
jgi:hypothetical protein